MGQAWCEAALCGYLLPYINGKVLQSTIDQEHLDLECRLKNMISLQVYIPKPTTSLSKATYAKSTPADFFALFDAAGLPTTSPPVTFPALVDSALDCGYGAPNGLDQSAFLAFTSPDTARLGDYQRARLALLMHLLHIDPVAGICRHTVARYLESSDKSDAAFILGGIACRIATEAWLVSRGGSLTRFWHYSIYSNPAVSGINFDVSLLKVGPKKKTSGKSASSPKPPKKYSDRRPDYLVECNRGRWYAVEAKGTFGNFDYSAVKDGMDQARRLRSITFADPLKGGPGLPPTRHVISDYACSCAFFDDDDRLSVNFVDPPADPTQTDGDDDVIDLEIDTTVAELLQFYRTVQQFRHLSGVRPRKLPAMLERFVSQMHWSEISFSPVRRRVEDRTRLWIGIPRQLDGEAVRMRSLLECLAVLSPMLREIFDERQNPQSKTSFERRLIEAAQDLQLRSSPKARYVVDRMLAAQLGSEEPPVNWSEAMRRCRQVKFKQGKREAASIDELVQSMRNAVKISDYVATTLRLDTSDVEPRATVRKTSSGLVIISGEPWEPPPLTRMARKLKI